MVTGFILAKRIGTRICRETCFWNALIRGSQLSIAIGRLDGIRRQRTTRFATHHAILAMIITGLL